MGRGVLKRLTFANVTASTALFIALGGTSYAAVSMPRNSVGAPQLRSASVGSSEVRNGSLELRDLSTRARAGLRGVRQPAPVQAPTTRGSAPTSGAQAPTATAGAPAAGAPSPAAAGARNVAVTYKTAVGASPVAPLDDTSIAAATATCDAGQTVTGGGVKLEDSYEQYVSDSYPDAAGRSWTAHVGNDDEANGYSFTVYAICSP